MQLSGEPQIESGVVDEHGEPGRLAIHLGHQTIEHPTQAPKMTQNLDQAYDGHVADVGDEPGTLGLQSIASDAKDGERGYMSTKVADQLRGIEVTGGFAA